MKHKGTGLGLLISENVKRVLQLWEKWGVYEHDFIHQLENSFLKQKEEIIEQNGITLKKVKCFILKIYLIF